MLSIRSAHLKRVEFIHMSRDVEVRCENNARLQIELRDSLLPNWETSQLHLTFLARSYVVIFLHVHNGAKSGTIKTPFSPKLHLDQDMSLM